MKFKTSPVLWCSVVLAGLEWGKLALECLEGASEGKIRGRGINKILSDVLRAAQINFTEKAEKSKHGGL